MTGDPDPRDDRTEPVVDDDARRSGSTGLADDAGALGLEPPPSVDLAAAAAVGSSVGGEEPGGGCAEVTRSVDLDAALDEVWEAVADPERRQGWLADDEAAGRELRIERVDDGRSLVWTWWSPDDPASASRVEVVLTELDAGGTRVAVTERLVGPGHVVARAAAASGPSTHAAMLWDRRLLGLELLFLTAGVCVG